jgi:hypothetical protein
MRAGLLPNLGVALSLLATGALGNVICDSKPDASMNHAAERIELCLEHFCEAPGTKNPAVVHCEQIVFSVTKLDAAPTEAGCLAQFKSIIGDCLTAKGVQGGILQAPEALYEVYAADSEGHEVPDEGEPKDADEDADEEQKEGEEENLRPQAELNRRARSKHTSVKGAKPPKIPKTHETPKAHKKPQTHGKPKAHKKPKTHKTPGCTAAEKKAHGGKCPPTCTAAEKKAHGGKCPTCTDAEKKKNGGKCPAKACAMKKKPGTAGAGTKHGGKKVVRNIGETLESLLPGVVARAILPRVGGSPSSPGRAGASGQDACGSDYKDWYRSRILNAPAKTKHWRFERSNGWSKELDEGIKDQPTDAELPAAKKILLKMTDEAKMDVIRVKKGKIEVKGKGNGGSYPEEWLDEAGSYVLSNGGFFVMDGSKQSPIGKTSHTTNAFPIPSEYTSDYAYLGSKAENEYFATGPHLMRDLVFTEAKWQYWAIPGRTLSDVARKPGSLAHASQPNERLVFVELVNGDKYLFAYTAKTRSHGVNLNKMREIILTFLKHMQNIDTPKSILNMDGGGSVYVAWKPQGKPFEVIARGETGDDAEAGYKDGHIRDVTNYLKLGLA